MISVSFLLIYLLNGGSLPKINLNENVSVQ